MKSYFAFCDAEWCGRDPATIGSTRSSGCRRNIATLQQPNLVDRVGIISQQHNSLWQDLSVHRAKGQQIKKEFFFLLRGFSLQETNDRDCVWYACLGLHFWLAVCVWMRGTVHPVRCDLIPHKADLFACQCCPPKPDPVLPRNPGKWLKTLGMEIVKPTEPCVSAKLQQLKGVLGRCVFFIARARPDEAIVIVRRARLRGDWTKMR